LQGPLGVRGLALAGTLLQWAVAGTFLVLLQRHHGLPLVDRALAGDLLMATAAALAVFAPVALVLGRSCGPLPGSLAALAGGALAFGCSLLPRYRTIPSGWRSLIRRPAA